MEVNKQANKYINWSQIKIQTSHESKHIPDNSCWIGFISELGDYTNDICVTLYE